MASRNAIDLAQELLAMKPTSGQASVEGVMMGSKMGCGMTQYGGGMDTLKEFYAKHRTPVLAVTAVVAIGLIGWGGYEGYKKWIWKPSSDDDKNKKLAKMGEPMAY